MGLTINYWAAREYELPDARAYHRSPRDPETVGGRTRDLRQGGFAPARRCRRRSRSQHQLAAGVALFELAVCIAYIVEGEHSGDRHVQLTSCDEVGQLGDHRCARSIRAACRLDPEPLHGSEIGDRVDLVGRDCEILDRHRDIPATEEI